jgi:hypothetical protein
MFNQTKGLTIGSLALLAFAQYAGAQGGQFRIHNSQMGGPSASASLRVLPWRLSDL